MAEKDVPNQLEDENMAPPRVPSHQPLPPPPEVHYTRPTLGKKSSPISGSASGSSTRGNEPVSEVNHGAGMAAGLSFVTSVIAGLLLGGWLDQHYIHSTTPWGTLGMTAVGTAVGFTNMFRLMSRGTRRKP
jgi:F0F1-type ATP synthase assembly protein I